VPNRFRDFVAQARNTLSDAVPSGPGSVTSARGVCN
jgi:hypothetical protein